VDKSAFTSLYDTFSGRIYGYIYWVTRNRESARDIVQTVFVKAWKHGNPPEDESEAGAWLYAIARNACTDHFRRCGRHRRFKLRYQRERVPQAHNHAEDHLVWTLLEGLSKKQRSMVYLHIREGYSYGEVARMMGMKETAVRVSVFRALRRLREGVGRDLR